jgi:hypothetical protein
VFVPRNTQFRRAKLSEVLRAEGFDVFGCAGEEAPVERLRREPVPPVLMLLSIPDGPERDLSELEEAREVPGFENVPILGVCGKDRSGLDLDQLRRLGVVGLLDEAAETELIVFRVKELVHANLRNQRRHARAPALLSVEVEVEGEQSDDLATSLSEGGLGLLVTRHIPPNSELVVRFRVPSAPTHVIEARGRVLWTQRSRRPDEEGYRCGLFFTAIAPEDRRRLAEEVRRVLMRTDF